MDNEEKICNNKIIQKILIAFYVFRLAKLKYMTKVSCVKTYLVMAMFMLVQKSISIVAIIMLANQRLQEGGITL